MRNKIALLILFLAFLVWFPGIYQPMLTLEGSVEKADLVELGKEWINADANTIPLVSAMATRVLDSMDISGTIHAYEKTRSILGTVRELFDSENYIVGLLIMLFSVVVPITKGLLLIAGALVGEVRFRGRAYAISNMISKWSMADVFVVAIIVGYLAANATRDMGEIFILNARFEPGFYYFLGYCLLSILSAQVMTGATSPESRGNEGTTA